MTALPGLDRLLADPLLTAVLEGKRDGLLLLDYDGTLAPFTARRDRARPYPGVVEMLCRLPSRGSGRFAVVSGRETAEVARFLSPAAPVEIWGCHGAQRLLADGGREDPVLPPATARALEEAFVLAARTAPADALERKPVSVAVHWRGLEPAAARDLERRVRRAWEPLAEAAGLAVHAFDGGLELRVPGWDKGRAVRFFRHTFFDTVLVYLGDDRTDEDAFRALGPAGIGVLVRGERRDSAARYRITPPGELLRLLTVWADALGAGELQPGRLHES